MPTTVSVTVELFVSAGNGTFTAANASGVTVAGSGSNTLTLTGTVANINTFLLGASRPSFTPGLNVTGDVSLRMTTRDGGNTGVDPSTVGQPATGAATYEEDVDTSIIRITPVNDAPTVTIAAPFVTTEDTPLALTGISFGDPDAGNNGVQVTLTIPAGSGTLSWVATPFINIDPASTPTNLILNGSYAAIRDA